MNRLLRGLFREFLIFLFIYGGWLLYVLLSHHLYLPVRLSYDVIMFKMLYISFQTYLVVAFVRWGLKLLKRQEKER